MNIRDLERNLVLQAREDNILSFEIWEPQKTFIVLGKSNVAHEEVYLDRCEDDDVPVTRRNGGGGAVVLTKGMLVISVSMLINAFVNKPLKWFRHINGLVVKVLEMNNVENLSHRGISDICIGTRKILGSSLYLPKNILLYQASLLVKSDLVLIEKYLKHPSREPAYREARSHGDFLMNLNDAVPGISIEGLKNNFEEVFHDNLCTVN